MMTVWKCPPKMCRITTKHSIIKTMSRRTADCQSNQTPSNTRVTSSTVRTVKEAKEWKVSLKGKARALVISADCSMATTLSTPSTTHNFKKCSHFKPGSTQANGL